jgi:hypothetical protein
LKILVVFIATWCRLETTITIGLLFLQFLSLKKKRLDETRLTFVYCGNIDRTDHLLPARQALSQNELIPNPLANITLFCIQRQTKNNFLIPIKGLSFIIFNFTKKS